jgi:hypothetical protein
MVASPFEAPMFRSGKSDGYIQFFGRHFYQCERKYGSDRLTKVTKHPMMHWHVPCAPVCSDSASIPPTIIPIKHFF